MDLLYRSEWGATLGVGPAMALPAKGIHVHHSVTIADDDHNYHATGDVAADMREIERIGRERFGRFPYSYCGHPSGWVAMGAGQTIGAHTSGFNSSSFGYCLIGNYETHEVTDEQVRAFRQWRSYMVDTGRLTADHYVKPHRDRKATACPGANTMRRWADLTAPEPTTEDDDMAISLDQIGLKVIEVSRWLVEKDSVYRASVKRLINEVLDERK